MKSTIVITDLESIWSLGCPRSSTLLFLFWTKYALFVLSKNSAGDSLVQVFLNSVTKLN
jgi:hypothetical protein